VSIRPANTQDRDGASDLLRDVQRRFSFIERIFADPKIRAENGANSRRCGTLENRANASILIVSSSFQSDRSSRDRLD
jgi:hypothetical protein